MKYAVAAVVSSLAFASGSAFAEGCNYGKYSDVVADKGEPLQSVVEPAQDGLRPGSPEDSSVGAAGLAAMVCAAGFTEGSSNTHPGQGTANRRFFFERFMLELLFVDDPTALASSHAPLNLQQRFTSSEASPFGIGFRPSAARGESAS